MKNCWKRWARKIWNTLAYVIINCRSRSSVIRPPYWISEMMYCTAFHEMPWTRNKTPIIGIEPSVDFSSLRVLDWDCLNVVGCTEPTLPNLFDWILKRFILSIFFLERIHDHYHKEYSNRAHRISVAPFRKKTRFNFSFAFIRIIQTTWTIECKNEVM